MSTDLDEFFARARAAADSVSIADAPEMRRRGDRRRRRQTAIIVFSVFAVVVATLGGVTLTSRQRSQPQPGDGPQPMPTAAPSGFSSLQRTGTALTFGAPGRQGDALTLAAFGSGYVAWHTRTPDSLVLARIDLWTSRVVWGPTTIAAQGEVSGLSIARHSGVLIMTSGISQPVRTTFVDAGSGAELWHTGAILFVAGDVVVAIEGADLIGRDVRTGSRRWRYQTTAARADDVLPSDLAAAPSAFGPLVAEDATWIAVMNAAGQVDLFSASRGSADEGRSEAGRRLMGIGSRLAGASHGEVYVTSPAGTPLKITGINATGSRDLYKGTWTSQSPVPVSVCLDTFLCFMEGSELVAVEAGVDHPAWRTDLGFEPQGRVTQIGARYVVAGGRVSDHTQYKVVDRDGRLVATYAPVQDDQHVDVLRDGVILGPLGTSSSARTLRFAAITRDGEIGELGQIHGTGLCTADDEHLVCLDDTDISTWSFR
ncbi:MAG: hypothetical protein HOU81_25110 [Hamadaea sp.]|uniref:hypothetical protein n=1 Tax=Hamadaea sp. TaxID=2024425 RepID=UPI0017EE10E4|nr:hypothetical protein [Hamadaea sp.]NUR74103.1 hypothetical protein [Hamadaea sp.]NUT19990.1 hypothetical protein [Hamadaea sp.]